VCSLLFERRILITSRRLGRLTACVHAAAALIYPLHWYSDTFLNFSMCTATSTSSYLIGPPFRGSAIPGVRVRVRVNPSGPLEWRTGIVHTARLGRVCFLCVFSLGLCFVCSFVLFDLFVCPLSFMFS